MSVVLRGPRYQLLAGDKYNITLGCLGACVLAACKEIRGLPQHVQWQFNAYTNWNLAFIGLRLLLGQEQWDPFLAVNSMGVLLGFRTAMSQGISDNMRLKLVSFGMPISRLQFFVADHMLHTVPAVALIARLVRDKKRVFGMNCVYATILSTWFSFRQGAQLDASGIYVPHPWRRAWFGIFVGAFVTPPFVDALIRRDRVGILASVLALLVPWLSTRLDPEMRRKYNFEFKLQQGQQSGAANRAPAENGATGGSALLSRSSRERLSRVASEQSTQASYLSGH
ncbi:unnamed protein product [Polarella glacialis]|uniref:Uncharacterized protein n=1 Tax=Polarella glacialis TaxID=89957 RepID=A0A813GU40_POLGL|nr:unnamed protein product [Polarella glacialis]CAE8694560.1 unnamed protein product [Polarella glacialis]CAE8704470.1 unnamed protein product [Polarella glacialis]